MGRLARRFLLSAIALLPSLAVAEVAHVELFGPPIPAFGARSFGATGAYERIVARATLALDPADPRNAGIVDLALAPRDATGRVEAVADVVVLRPIAPGAGNRTLLIEAPNRGREVIGQLYNGIDAANGLAEGTDAGNGFLLRQGYTLAWIGWQADLPAAAAPGRGPFRLSAPVLRDVTGLSREEFVFDNLTDPATATLTYPAVAGGRLSASIRAYPDHPRRSPADLRVRVTDARNVAFTRPAGFDAGALYEVIYEAAEPTVQGIAFAAIRDIAAYLRWNPGDANPLASGGASRVDRAVLFGVSQSGRFVRDLLYQGFNTAAPGTRVFDAMLPHIAGTRRTFTNARFAQPGRNPTQHGDTLYPADQFPFTYGVARDHLTGRTDGLLARCAADGTCPLIMQTDSEYEFHGARASLLMTDTRGEHLDLPDNVRAYAFPGHPHFAAADAIATRDARCALPVNPLHAGAPMRALLVAMERWMRDGTPPPPNRYPNRADGTLVAPERAHPALLALGYRGAHARALLADHAAMPPLALGEYPVFVPRADADGNAVGGVRLPAIAVPKATYTGWNPRLDGFAPGALCTNTGGVVAFPERPGTAGDTRRSLQERYPTASAYVDAVLAVTRQLEADRFVLAEDAAAIRRSAERDTLARLRPPP